MHERCSSTKLQERSEQLLTSETSKKVSKATPTPIRITTILTILMRENSSLGSSLFSLRTNSPKQKSTIFGKTKEECSNLPTFTWKDHARTSQFRKAIGSARMNNGKIYFYRTTEAAPINTFKSTTNWQGFGILSKRTFPACTELWQAQLRTISKTQATSLPE